MRSRNEHVQLWLNRKEAATLARRAKACGITQSAYLRHLIMGFVPREQPSPDYYAFMRSLYSLMTLILSSMSLCRQVIMKWIFQVGSQKTDIIILSGI